MPITLARPRPLNRRRNPFQTGAQAKPADSFDRGAGGAIDTLGQCRRPAGTHLVTTTGLEASQYR